MALPGPDPYLPLEDVLAGVLRQWCDVYFEHADLLVEKMMKKPVDIPMKIRHDGTDYVFHAHFEFYVEPEDSDITMPGENRKE